MFNSAACISFYSKILIACFCISIFGCASPPTPTERLKCADSLASAHSWYPLDIQTDSFKLHAYLPVFHKDSNTLTIYIEGDGFAWYSINLPSDDPTPINPIGLKLALAQPNGVAVYLARPCQYLEKKDASYCSAAVWTNERYSEKVIYSTNQAIDILKEHFHAKKLTLVGYSGGAAVAALVAVRRDDIDKIITVAGNMDHRAWSAYERISPLDGSLDPVDFIGSLENIKQWYLVGGKDTVVPSSLTQQFVNQFSIKHRPKILLQADFDHHCCWVEHWPSLWRNIEQGQKEINEGTKIMDESERTFEEKYPNQKLYLVK